MEELLAIPGLTRGGDDGGPRKRKAREARESDPSASDDDSDELGPSPSDGEEADDASPSRTKTSRRGEGGSVDGSVGAHFALHPLDGRDRVMGVVKIPARLVHVVIGKGGWGLKTVEGITGATLTVERDTPFNVGDPTRAVEVKGSAAQVAAACDMIVEQVDAQGGEGSSAPEARKKIPIEEELIAAVIGKQGVTINAIKQLSGAAVDLVEEIDAGMFACVAGTNEAVAAATKLVYDVIGAGNGDDIVAQAREGVDAIGDGKGDDGDGKDGATAAGDGESAAVNSNDAAAAMAGTQDWGPWRTVASQHPDGSPMLYYLNADTGAMQFEPPKLPARRRLRDQ